MSSFGHLILCVATVLSAAGGALVLNGRNRPRWMRAGSDLLHAASAASAVALGSLVFLLVTYDFRVSYVRDYADRTMSIEYLIMAIWADRKAPSYSGRLCRPGSRPP